MAMRDKTECQWIIGHAVTTVFCMRTPTHYEPEGCAQFCRQHAEDYIDIFGDDTLREFPIEEEQP